MTDASLPVNRRIFERVLHKDWSGLLYSVEFRLMLRKARYSDPFAEYYSQYMASVIIAKSTNPIFNRLPELQQEFCDVWNELVQIAGNRNLSIYILKHIRNVYCSLHQGPTATPTAFSTTTPDRDRVLLFLQSYPFYTIARQRPAKESSSKDVPSAQQDSTSAIPKTPSARQDDVYKPATLGGANVATHYPTHTASSSQASPRPPSDIIAHHTVQTSGLPLCPNHSSSSRFIPPIELLPLPATSSRVRAKSGFGTSVAWSIAHKNWTLFSTTPTRGLYASEAELEHKIMELKYYEKHSFSHIHGRHDNSVVAHVSLRFIRRWGFVPPTSTLGAFTVRFRERVVDREGSSIDHREWVIKVDVPAINHIWREVTVVVDVGRRTVKTVDQRKGVLGLGIAHLNPQGVQIDQGLELYFASFLEFLGLPARLSRVQWLRSNSCEYLQVSIRDISAEHETLVYHIREVKWVLEPNGAAVWVSSSDAGYNLKVDHGWFEWCPPRALSHWQGPPSVQ
ncbi:hypothetical protein EDB86DRAFT_2830296 [Lactarius hatsudake]|nr:hypothetical protein EDB86DRAFT_2830296 [Lactarius hatsudake]